MRGISTVITMVLLTTLMPGPVGYAESSIPEKPTPPGHIDVVTVNAKQGAVIGEREFERMFELTRALQSRPKAFNGGASGAVMVPDVIVVQEIRYTNLEIFRLLLNQRFDTAQYRDVGPENDGIGVLANLNEVSLVGEVTMLNDVCVTPATPLKNGRTSRPYPIARFTENRSGLPFVVAGVHLVKNYAQTGQEDCRFRNALALRSVLTSEPSPAVLAGDFNQRAMMRARECDIEERSDPQPWYGALTEPDDDGQGFSDTVRGLHRARRASMSSDWTLERRRKTELCDGSKGHRRDRIDYLFASGAVTADAHADHPGWSRGEPGSKHPTNFKYSNHRFVWARVVISGVPRSAAPMAVPVKGGRIDLSWGPVQGVTKWIVLRSGPRSRYRAITRLAVEQTTFTDTATRHETKYRYAIVGVGPNGGWSRESRGEVATADGRGPIVVRVSPWAGATEVDVRSEIEVGFDERVDAASVDSGSIRLFRGDRRLRGQISQPARRVLIFDPARRLKKGATYRVVVRGLTDVLGNPGPRFAWRFTAERPRRRR